MPKRVHRPINEITPLRVQLDRLGSTKEQLRAAIAEDVMADPLALREGQGTRPNMSSHVALMRSSAPKAAMSDMRTERFIYRIGHHKGPVFRLMRGAQNKILALPEDKMLLRQTLGPAAAVAVQVMVDRACDSQTLGTLLAKSSAQACKLGMHYLVGQILSARLERRLSRPEDLAELERWLGRLLTAYQPGSKPVVMALQGGGAVQNQAEVAAAFALDGAAYRLFAQHRNAPHPLLAQLRQKTAEQLLLGVEQQHYAVSVAVLVLTHTQPIPGLAAAADETMRAMLQQLLLESTQDSSQVKLAALKVYAHQCLTAGRLTWLSWCLDEIGPLPSAKFALNHLLFVAVAMARADAVTMLLNAGASSAMRCERQVTSQCNEDQDVVKEVTYKSSSLLHASVAMPSASEAQRLAVVDALIAHGADPCGLAVWGNSQAKDSYGYLGTTPGMHALLAGHATVAQYLVAAQQANTARREQAMLPVLQQLSAALFDLAQGERHHGIEPLAPALHALAQLQWDHGFGLMSATENVLLERVQLGLCVQDVDPTDGKDALHDELSPSPLDRALMAAQQEIVEERLARLMPGAPNSCAETVSAKDCLREAHQHVDAYLKAHAPPHNFEPTSESAFDAVLEEEAQHAARCVSTMSLYTYLSNCGPLSYCVLRGELKFLRGYVGLGSTIAPSDVALAYALTYQPAHGALQPAGARKPRALNKEMRAQLLPAAATPTAMVALMQVAARLGDAQGLQAIMLEAERKDVDVWRHRGPSSAMLGSLVAEMAPEAMAHLLASAKSSGALERLFSFVSDGGDTIFHVAMRAPMQTLEALLALKPVSEHFLRRTNICGQTAFDVGLDLQRGKMIDAVLRRYPEEALACLSGLALTPLDEPTQRRTLDTIAGLMCGRAWLRQHLPPLTRALQRSAPHRAQRLRRRYGALVPELAGPSVAAAAPQAPAGEASPAPREPAPIMDQAAMIAPARPTHQDIATLGVPAREEQVIAWLSRIVSSAPADDVNVHEGWRMIYALHVAGGGRGMGRHFTAHEPQVSLAALKERAFTYRRCAASRFGKHDSVTLLQLRQQARAMMLERPVEPLALFAVNLVSPKLRGDGVLLDADCQEGVYYRNSRTLRFVMRHNVRHGDVDFVAIYPIPDASRGSAPSLRRL